MQEIDNNHINFNNIILKIQMHPGDEIVQNFYKFVQKLRGQTICESFSRLKYFYKGCTTCCKSFVRCLYTFYTIL